MATIKERLYKNFKNNWIAKHISKETYEKTYQNYMIDSETETFEEYVEEYGFANGMLYPCYQEWQDNEFEDADNIIIDITFGLETGTFLIQDLEETNIKNVFEKAIKMLNSENNLSVSYEKNGRKIQTVIDAVQEISDLNIIDIQPEEILNLYIQKIVRIDT